ncbi:MAG TPA: CNNM domain-containing protein [Elusimicrobiales bacterium]|nr:CNNM domain-containing protein [Elusimicrobiales bacterium]
MEVIYFLDLFIALLLIALNAVFVLVEFALVKVRFTRLEELAANGLKAAKLAKKQVQQIDAYLSSIQLGITMASLGLGWVGEPAMAAILEPVFAWLALPLPPAMLHSVAFVIAFALITGVHVIVGEQAPKYIAILMPEQVILLSAIPLEIFYKATYFPMLVINKSANFVLNLLHLKPSESEALHSDDELRMILGQSQEHGKLSLGRLMMFEHLFDFGKTKVKEVMTLRGAIASIDPAAPWEDTQKLLREKRFSRYPLRRPDGTMSGYVHLKDLAYSACRVAPDGRSGPDLQAAKRPLAEISGDISVERALRDFQEKRRQLALVCGPKGEVTGLLTMEDIIEELTGEIRDEFDQPPNLLLSSLLVPQSCSLELENTGRFEAIEEVLNKLHKASPSFSREDALAAIIKRESNFSTALGHQTAFPHARLASLSKPLLAIGKSRDGIAFPAPDNQPVKVIFMILTPFNEPTMQLNILKQLSGLISNVTLRKRLFSATTPENLMDVIRTFENKVME